MAFQQRIFTLHARLARGNHKEGDYAVSDTFQVSFTISDLPELPEGDWEVLLLARPGEIDKRVITLGIPSIPRVVQTPEDEG
jgi:hypothetical protein